MEKFGKLCLWILLFIITSVVRAYAITLAYNWLLVTMYQIKEINYIEGFALSFAFAILKGYSRPVKADEDEEWYTPLASNLGYNAFSILVSYIIYINM
jgi:hypothetical protein